ncbi:probable serine/threonine-protein kinase At1g54610 isoform X2 [Rhodamnia argentea]|uniref:Probable serine/threonine-protein kinase At1g54610 n=1 Tax=Rhodamnia argentea TaxID=178133 RepID=A0A8B8QQD5_9MYRT|nr:probable serine/threonine-protein kinase At1g54610 isoform X1 [Rhodamnia argentea]XP_030549396.1 probable serine/threonine-protein kinase At1g54610 isoform X1 [Rhodamnia argentea]XP_048137803.1 probable serine/threonine-protein kinase At1g54610 isoform X2 [Rhodamnia argentea]
MGCMYSKGSAVDDSRESPKDRVSSSRRLAEAKTSRLDSSRRENGFRARDKVGDVNVMLIDDKKVNGSARLYDDQIEKKIDHIQKQRRERAEAAVATDRPGAGRVPKAVEGEQLAAGWPVWLTAVAGEAIKGWLPRRADTFEKLDKIGQGTYSSVYRARDVINNKIVALKRVRFDNLDTESVKFMAREIHVLRMLDHPNVIKLEGLITSRMSCSLYLVFEYMEHDLTGLASRPGVKFSEPQIKCYMKQLLSGLDHCHKHGILHRDIKGSNLLIDNNGILKIADFGLASVFDPHQTAPLTSRVVTLWYRPPELLLGASRYGVEVDLWSTGCILGELYSGKPILPGKTEVEQLHKIFKLCGSPTEDYWRRSHLPHAAVFKPPQPYRRCVAETFKELPPAALGLLETLISVDPSQRGTAAFALRSEFFTTSPLPCDPSSLPKYPPSKEIDMKLREEEVRRRGATGGKSEFEKKGTKDSRSNTAHYPRAEQMQVKQSHSNSNSRSEIFGTHQEKTVSGFLVAPPKQARVSNETRKDYAEQPNRTSYSGPLFPGLGFSKAEKELDHSITVSRNTNLSTLSSLVASRTALAGDKQKSGPLVSESASQARRFSGPLREMEPVRKQDRRSHVRTNIDSRLREDGNANTKEPALYGRGSEGNKIYVSGPLLVSSNNVDQMLKEHDRRIQEYARRARLDKTRAGKDHP